MTPYFDEAGIQLWRGDCRALLPFDKPLVHAQPALL